MVEKLRLSNKIIALDGDITLPNCGLAEAALESIRKNVSIFVHGALTISLKQPLAEVAKCVVYPSLALAKIAISSAKFDQFVYISTAYSSTFLRGSEGMAIGADAVVQEAINPISSNPTRSLDLELSDLVGSGCTPEYEVVQHPFAYTYAKHLTERLLLRQFDELDIGDNCSFFNPPALVRRRLSHIHFTRSPAHVQSLLCFQRFSLARPKACGSLCTYRIHQTLQLMRYRSIWWLID